MISSQLSFIDPSLWHNDWESSQQSLSLEENPLIIGIAGFKSYNYFVRNHKPCQQDWCFVIKKSVRNTTNLFAGLDSILLDNRKFDVSAEDVDRICQFFHVGKIKNYEKEKSIAVSHSNFIVFIATNQGEYILKFYPSNTAKNITTELLLNRFLTKHHFPTPAMHASRSQKPFIKTNTYLATCFTFINGSPAYQKKMDAKTIRAITAGIFRLKQLLANNEDVTAFLYRESLSQKISALARKSASMTSFCQKNSIDRHLLKAYKIYNSKKSFFSEKHIHTNISLSNILFYKEKPFFLDLSHIKNDYELNDLASLLISCFFFETPFTTIKRITQDYFFVHELTPDHLDVLTVFLKLGLIKEYLKLENRGKPQLETNDNLHLFNLYLAQLKKRKKTILDLLKTLDASPQTPFYP